MTIMTKTQDDLLDQLNALAGSPRVVEEALRTLNEETQAPTMQQIVRRILEILKRQQESAVTTSR